MKNRFPILLLAVLCSCGGHPKHDSASECASAQDSCAVAPVVETPVSKEYDASGFVLLTDVVPDAILEIRYYSTYNFIGTRIDGYEQPVALMTREGAEALKAVSASLKSQGYLLKVFDAYRPQKAVDHFVRWAKDQADTLTKQYFYPEIPKSEIFPRGFVSAHSGHSRGSTIDLTLFDMRTEREVDMGGTFDFFGDRSHFAHPVEPEQRRLRNLLRQEMSKGGFRPIEGEWWHFTLRNEPYPDTYFAFPNSVESLPNE